MAQVVFRGSLRREGLAAGGQPIIEYGNFEFTTTGTTVQVPTQLQVCHCALALPDAAMTHTSNSADLLYCDRTVDSDGITVSRGASGTSDLGFNYLFIGQ
jgi:hypothetical protein